MKNLLFSFNLPGASSAGITCSGHDKVTCRILGCHFVLPSRTFSAVESMDEGTKGRVREFLSEASRLLSSSTSSNAASNSSRPGAIPYATINETLRRAQGMLIESLSTGLCRRLNRQERLREAAGTSYQRTSQAKSTAKKQKKVLEFALLRCWDADDADEVHHLKWNYP